MGRRRGRLAGLPVHVARGASLRQRRAGNSADGASAAGEVVDLVAPPLRVLRAVQRDQQFPVSPEIGLGVPWLFTAGKGSPSLLQEIRRELASSDQVDILVSFITVSGVRKLQDVLQQITAKGAQQAGQAPPQTRLHGSAAGLHPCANLLRDPVNTLQGSRSKTLAVHAPLFFGMLSCDETIVRIRRLKVIAFCRDIVNEQPRHGVG